MPVETISENGHLTRREFNQAMAAISTNFEDVKKLITANKEDQQKDRDRLHDRIDTANTRLDDAIDKLADFKVEVNGKLAQMEVADAVQSTRTDQSMKNWGHVVYIVLIILSNLITIALSGLLKTGG